MTRLVYFSTTSGNTARMVARMGLPALRVPISPSEPLPQITTEFVLICPTYSDGEGRGAVPKQVIRFLNDSTTRGFLRGVIAGGNRNFGQFFGHAGTVIAAKCAVPCLARFELAGSDTDIARIRDGLLTFWSAPCLTTN